MRKGVKFWGVVVCLTVILAIFLGVALAEQIFEDSESYEFEQSIPDAYEPDDNYSLANYISVNGTKQTHDFHVPDDHDWLKFNASGGNAYTIETSDLGPASDTYLYLYDTNGTAEIRHDDDSGVGLASKINWYCGDSGTYYIMVRHFNLSASGPETRYNISVNHTILPARFNDVYSDCGSDTDSNGFYDYLAIDVGVNVSKAGYYRIGGDLYNSSGWYVDWAYNYTTLDAGNQTVQLRFFGPRIWLSRTNGTFDLRYLSLYNATDWSEFDYRYYAYTTTIYNYTDFRPPTVFVSGIWDYGYDENSNELFDYLVIEKQINVTSAGNYELYGHLYYGSGYGIDSNYNYTYLNAGLHNLTIKFRGYKIYNSKSTGNFTVYMELYGNSTYGLYLNSTAGPPASIDSEMIEKSFWENKNIVESRSAEINNADISCPDKPLAVSSQQHVGVSSWGHLDSAEDITSFYNYTQFEPPIPDAYEPDDNYSLANYISVNGTKQTHDFHVPDDHDWLKFNASGGKAYTIETSDLGPASDTYLYLYDTNGTAEIRRDDDSGVGLASKINWYCGDSGTYYIMVRHFSSTASGPETRYNISVVQVFFDTGTSANPYPSISGTHNGTITMTHTVNVSTIFSYPCIGTGGHIEYAKIWNSSWGGAEAHWHGYVDDWHNCSFDENFMLVAGETYNYTIRTGSYPQIIHKPSWKAIGGIITCEEFVDVNGNQHEGWIPAIRLH